MPNCVEFLLLQDHYTVRSVDRTERSLVFGVCLTSDHAKATPLGLLCKQYTLLSFYFKAKFLLVFYCGTSSPADLSADSSCAGVTL